MMNPFDLVSLLRGKRVFLQTHDFPDPDAVASACALQHLLGRLGIPSTICCYGLIDRVAVSHLITGCNISLRNAADLTDLCSNDLIVLVDGQKNNSNMTDLAGQEIACIDHHPCRADVQYAYADIRQVGACSSIIADYFRETGIEMPRDMATILLYGLKVDTESMRRGVTDLDLDVFSWLYRIADHQVISDLEGKTLEFSDLKAFASAIETIQVYRRTGFVHIPFACPDALVAQVADFILSIAEVDIAVIWSSRAEGLRFSIRSHLSNIHCGTLLSEVLAGAGTAGGHIHMAGGFIPRANYALLAEDPGLLDSRIIARFLAWIEKHAGS